MVRWTSMLQWLKTFLLNQSVSTSSSFFYICFCSLFINKRLVFVSFRVKMFVLSFVLVFFCIFDYLYWNFRFCPFLLFSFLIIYIETFGLRRLLCNTNNKFQ